MTHFLAILLYATVVAMAAFAGFTQFGCTQEITGANDFSFRKTADGFEVVDNRGSSFIGPASSGVTQNKDGSLTIKPSVEPFPHAKYAGTLFVLLGIPIIYFAGRKANVMGIALGGGLIAIGVIGFFLPGLLPVLAVLALGAIVWWAVDAYKHKKIAETKGTLAKVVAGGEKFKDQAEPEVVQHFEASMSGVMDAKDKDAIKEVKGLA